MGSKKDEFDQRIRDMFGKALGDCMECDMRDIYRIWWLSFGDLGLTTDQMELVEIISEMIYLTYESEVNPRDGLYFLGLQYVYSKLINQVFDLTTRTSLQDAEKLRRIHFHSWWHRAVDYRRGFLCDTICHAEEAIFRAARDAMKSTNGKDHVTETTVRKMRATEEWNQEHGRLQFKQSGGSWTKMLWETKRRQKALIIPAKWAYGARSAVDRRDFEMFLDVISDYDLHYYGIMPQASMELEDGRQVRGDELVLLTAYTDPKVHPEALVWMPDITVKREVVKEEKRKAAAVIRADSAERTKARGQADPHQLPSLECESGARCGRRECCPVNFCSAPPLSVALATPPAEEQLSKAEVKKMTVLELKAELRRRCGRNANLAGRKPDLVARLTAIIA